MNVTVDFDELLLRIIDGMDDRYSKLSHALQVCEMQVTFDELFEQLLSYEAQLANALTTDVAAPVTAMAAPVGYKSSSNPRGWGSSSSYRPQYR